MFWWIGLESGGRGHPCRLAGFRLFLFHFSLLGRARAFPVAAIFGIVEWPRQNYSLMMKPKAEVEPRWDGIDEGRINGAIGPESLKPLVANPLKQNHAGATPVLGLIADK